MWQQLWRDERGATAIEYALVASLISIVFVAAFVAMGLSLTDIFTTVSNALAGAHG